MSFPSAEAIASQIEKSKPRILQLDPIVIAYFGDLQKGIRTVLEKKSKDIILGNQPHYTDQSKPKCDPVGSYTEIVCRFD